MAKEKVAKPVIPICKGDYCCRRATENGFCVKCNEVKQ